MAAEKRLFLLDENVVGRIVHAEMLPALQLFVAIFRNCHAVLVSPSIYEKFWCRVKHRRRSLQDSEIVAGFVRLLNVLSRTDEKNVWREDNDPPQNVLIRHEKDHFLAGLAAQTPAGGECIFVSTDRQTRDDFDAADRKGLLNVRAVTIEEALELARQPAADSD